MSQTSRRKRCLSGWGLTLLQNEDGDAYGWALTVLGTHAKFWPGPNRPKWHQIHAAITEATADLGRVS